MTADPLHAIFTTDDLAQRQAIGAAILATYRDNPAVLIELGRAAERLRDPDDLNAAAPGEPLDGLVMSLLALDDGQASPLHRDRAIATAGRVAGRWADAPVDAAHQRILAQVPPEGRADALYNYGLFLKTRGRFADGLTVNLAALELQPDNPPALWNAMICATGAGDGEAALRLNRALGVRAELGRCDLPDGTFPMMQVRLAERPLAERDGAHDHPGAEETSWVERLSACHGVVRSVLVAPLGVDYGDVVLFDGAPLTVRRIGDRQVPMHPHLATLARPGYRALPMVGVQPRAQGVADLSEQLPSDAVLYSHTENVRHVCAECWANPMAHDHNAQTHHVVRGKLAFGPDLSPVDLGAALDAAVAQAEGAPWSVLVPDLWDLAGDPARAQAERERMDALVD